MIINTKNGLGDIRYLEYIRMKSSPYLKIRKIIKILRHKSEYVNKISYYPEYAHKTKSQILREQIRFVWKYGYLETYYFTYGFDRADMTREKMETYITPYYPFVRRIDHLNFQNPYYDDFNGKMTCRVINQDKFYFYLFLSRLGFHTPKVYCFIKNKTIMYADSSYNIDNSLSAREQLKIIFAKDIDAFAKPSDGMMGQGVFRLQIKDAKPYIDGAERSIDELIDTVLSADYILQETIVQDARMSKLCSSSVNTIRLQTVMDKNGDVIPFGAMIRIGREGSSVDNWAKGGVIVGINDDGKLKDVGFLKPKYGTTTKEHPDNHLIFDGYEIPHYQEAVNKAVELHKIMYRSHSIGWDIAITQEGPMFIEGNDRWEISMVQAVHGGMGYLMKYFDY